METQGSIPGALIEAASRSEFLPVLQKIYRNLTREEREDQCVAQLAELHNTQQIDIVQQFNSLRNEPESDIDFFMVRRVIEKAIPLITHSLPALMRCVIKLHKEAGSDMLAGSIVNAFGEHIENQAERIEEAWAIAIDPINKCTELTLCVILSGAKNDFTTFFSRAVSMASATSKNTTIQHNAIAALGRLPYENAKRDAQKALSELEKLSGEPADDVYHAAVGDSLVRIAHHVKRSEKRVASALVSCLRSGGQQTIATVAQAMAYGKEFPSRHICERVIPEMTDVSEEMKGIHSSLDRICEQAIEKYQQIDLIRIFLEQLSEKHKGVASSFDKTYHGVAAKLREKEHYLLRYYATTWFLNGHRSGCEIVADVLMPGSDRSVEFTADSNQLKGKEGEHIYFACRKAVGYLFARPVELTSFLLSVLPQIANTKWRSQVIALIYEFPALNHVGTVAEYLRAVEETKGTKKRILEACRQVLKSVDDYWANITAAGEIVEMQPSDDQRHIAHMRQVHQMNESVNKARSDTLLNLFSKVTMLYGKTSVHHMHMKEETKRVEMPLQSISSSYEMPRRFFIDKPSLNRAINVFRVEHYRA